MLLKFPFKVGQMLCGYKNSEYKKYWGYDHLGIDLTSIQGIQTDDHNIYASGEGIVVSVGRDNSLGYGVCIQYNDCEDINGNRYDLVFRYMHCKEVLVKLGQKVYYNTPIAVEGKEGTQDYHLHLECDTDLKYPTYSPQVSKGHAYWKKGTDSTLNPSLFLYTDIDREVLKPTYNPSWLNETDYLKSVYSQLKKDYPNEIDYKQKYENLRQRITELYNSLGG